MNNKIDLPENAGRCITGLAEKNGLKKVILYGSRARGDNRQRSDIDIAVGGGDTDGFMAEIQDTCDTLLFFDVVDLEKLKGELSEIIKKEGVLIYEKA